MSFFSFCLIFLYNARLNPNFPPHLVMISLVLVVLALNRSNREPSSIRAIVVNHMVRPDPNQLMTLVHIQLGHNRLVPPVPLLPITAAPPSILDSCNSCWTRTTVNLKSLIGCYKGRVWPISLNKPTLRSPIIRIPNRTIHTHWLILGVWDPSVLQIRMHTNRGLIYQESVLQQIQKLSNQEQTFKLDSWKIKRIFVISRIRILTQLDVDSTWSNKSGNPSMDRTKASIFVLCYQHHWHIHLSVLYMVHLLYCLKTQNQTHCGLVHLMTSAYYSQVKTESIRYTQSNRKMN